MIKFLIYPVFPRNSLFKMNRLRSVQELWNKMVIIL